MLAVGNAVQGAWKGYNESDAWHWIKIAVVAVIIGDLKD